LSCYEIYGVNKNTSFVEEGTREKDNMVDIGNAEN
jgi:hypothetical protein